MTYLSPKFVTYAPGTLLTMVCARLGRQLLCLCMTACHHNMSPNGNIIYAQTDQSRLIKHTVDCVRTRLDRVYLNALQEPVAETHGEEQHPEGAELQEELESLYAEILPVSQMATEQEYLEPALKEIEVRSGVGQVRTEEAVEYVSNTLSPRMCRQHV